MATATGAALAAEDRILNETAVVVAKKGGEFGPSSTTKTKARATTIVFGSTDVRLRLKGQGMQKTTATTEGDSFVVSGEQSPGRGRGSRGPRRPGMLKVGAWTRGMQRESISRWLSSSPARKYPGSLILDRGGSSWSSQNSAEALNDG